MNWYWLILALVSMSVSGYLIGYANRISEGGTWEPASDWFWGGDVPEGWTLALEPITRIEPNAPQESEPKSEAD